ncbi:MAG: nucleotidyl transferase AbiEii/AbiGii toxin family protein [Nanoarchaeota archaeon]|nr:nucleotidyl transferase AbiEii/AbiGii toxin family protein [Nanoarchaeota archaeon]
MGWKEINKSKYLAELRKNLHLEHSDEIIEKDLLLTIILAEMEKRNLGQELIFKGGTLLSRNYLEYHRFSEDLDFVHKDSGILRELPKSTREKKIKKFVDFFTPELKKVADALELEFSTDRSNKRFCKMLNGRVVYTFKLYYSDAKFIKVEINFVEKMHYSPIKISVRAITDLFDSKELMFLLNLKLENFNVLSYPLEEITLEKYRAILTRKYLKERDLFDLFLIKDSLELDIKLIVEKIKNSSLIKRNLENLIKEKLDLLNNNKFFKSDEKIEELVILDYKKEEFEKFKEKIKPILIETCKRFLESTQN